MYYRKLVYKLVINVSAEAMLFYVYLYIQYYHILPSDLKHTNLISFLSDLKHTNLISTLHTFWLFMVGSEHLHSEHGNMCSLTDQQTCKSSILTYTVYNTCSYV